MGGYVLSEETIHRIYAGWLGKIIGIRLGAPVESWTAEKIREVYGEIQDYPVDYGIFAADDDSNGPVFFVRALKDGGHGVHMKAADVAEALLNYAPYEHGFFWWGGYGVSTEHTAYLNLQNGIPAKVSGSILKNGSTIAEQIGGQIFIDPWGLVSPGNPALAASLAREAASVTHDRNGIYGGMFIAACIALAFSNCPIRDMIEEALHYIPADSEYTRVVQAVCAYYDQDTERDWHGAFAYVQEHFGYDRYEGWCHIIPNAAVIVLALLYGEDDFSRTLCIGNLCGWDTDCNVGNLGTIMGVRAGCEGIPYEKWRKPINDLLLCSGVLGDLNIQDIPYGAFYMAECAFALAGEELPEVWKSLATDQGVERCHFVFPGSTHAMRVRAEEGGDTPHLEAHLRNVEDETATGKRSLLMHAYPLHSGQDVYLYQQTYYRHEELHDDRYEPAFSPKLYPGQTLRAMVRIPEGREATQAALYVRDLRSGEVTGETVTLKAGVWQELTWRIPPMAGALLSEAGVRFTVPGDAPGLMDFMASMDLMEYGGEPEYSVVPERETLLELPASHYEVSQFTKLKGWTYLEEGELHLSAEQDGETYTGSRHGKDYALTARFRPIYGEAHFLLVRVQGGERSYAAGFDGENRLVIRKNHGVQSGGYHTLAETEYPWERGTETTLTVCAMGNRIAVLDAKGQELLAYVDEHHPYESGCIGVAVQRGSHLSVREMRVRPLET